MRKKTQNKVKQPISLRWKWGVLLFIAISIVGLASVGFSNWQNTKTLKEDYQAECQARFDQIKSYFNNLDQPVQDFLDQSYIQTYLDASPNTLAIYGNDGHLIYQNTDLTLAPAGYSDQMDELDIDSTQYLVAKSPIRPDLASHEVMDLVVAYPMDNLKILIDKQNQQAIKVSIWIVLLAGLLSLVISYLFYKPLSYLINSLDRVEEENLSDIRMRKPRSNDEWSDLSLHVNKLLDRLDKYVTSQKEFVEDVSHELRTPVAVVQGHLNLIKRWGKDDPEVLEESIDMAIQEMSRMETLIQEMLDLSRADSVDVDYKDEVTEVYSTIDQVYNNFVMIHPDFKFYLDIDRDQNEVYIRMFRNHFEQVLIIVLDNAVKYSSDRKEVHISVSEGLNKIEVAIQDFGVGMSPEDKNKAFDRFYRADKARSRQKGGTGLGLSIARQLTQGYKGDIRVESSLGQGSIFYIEFPVIQDPEKIQEAKAKVKKQENLLQ